MIFIFIPLPSYWNGKKLQILNGEINIEINRLGCIVGLKKSVPAINILALIKKQKAEQAKPLPIVDTYAAVLSIKKALPVPAVIKQNNHNFSGNLLKIEGGSYSFIVKHAQREGDCYPDKMPLAKQIINLCMKKDLSL